MQRRYESKNILIIGASSGMGHEIAQRMLAEGANVFVVGQHRPDLDVEFSEWDALDPKDEAFAGLPDVLHGIIYCAGTINLKPFNRLSLADFTRDWQMNALGAVAAIQPNITRLKKAAGASVVLFSSVAANTGFGFHASISMAKSALQGLALSLAAEYAASSIRFNVIAPSLTDTPLAQLLLSSDDKREASAKRHPLGRYGKVSDLAAAAVYLASDEASWITGQVLGVDGGLGKLK